MGRFVPPARVPFFFCKKKGTKENQVKFDGFTKLYEESKDNDEEEGGALPALEVGEKLNSCFHCR